jgi:protein gp37
MPTRIEWTDESWNPVTGCSALSRGCERCYARRWAIRLRAMGQPRYAAGFEVTEHPEALEIPLGWRRPRRIFTVSMGDLFHEAVRLEFIQSVFEIMDLVPHHSFQVLTKRPERAAELANALFWPANLWLGTTVEDAGYLDRIPALLRVPVPVHFLSLEPLLGPIDLVPSFAVIERAGSMEPRPSRIGWVIVGGETGPGARGMAPGWPRTIRDQCVAAGVPFFFKRWGGSGPERDSRTLDGRLWEQTP